MADRGLSESTRRRVARSVWTRNLRLRPGERVTIEAWNHTLPWSVSLAHEARRLGARPLILYEDEASYWEAVADGGARLLGSPMAHEFAALARTDVYVHMWGPGDRVRLAALSDRQQEQLFAYNSKWYEAAQKAGLRGVRLEFGRVYPSLARAYGAVESTWVDQLVRGTLVDPARLARDLQRVAKVVGRRAELRLRHPNGTDLTLRLSGTPASVFAGIPRARGGHMERLATLPAGSLRVPLDLRVARGTLVGNRTNYYEGSTARGPTLHFADGRLTDFSFEQGGEEFEDGFRSGGTGRDRPGILGIGMNPALRDTPQLEDVERGAVMVSVGGNRHFGGRNSSSFFGWAIVAGASLEINDTPLAL